MSLDDIVKGEIKTFGNHAFALESVKQNVEAGNGPSDNGHYDELIATLTAQYSSEVPLSDADRALIHRHIGTESVDKATAKNLPKAYESVRSKLIKRVTPVYEPILDELNGEKLFSLVLETDVPSTDDKEHDEFKEEKELKRRYESWQKGLEKKDTSAYLDKSHPFIKDIYKTLPKDKILADMAERVAYEQEQFMSKFTKNMEALREALKNKDMEAVDKLVDTDKMRKYLKTIVPGLDEANRNEFYSSLGTDYSNYLIEKDKKKANASAKAQLGKEIEARTN